MKGKVKNKTRKASGQSPNPRSGQEPEQLAASWSRAGGGPKSCRFFETTRVKSSLNHPVAQGLRDLWRS